MYETILTVVAVVLVLNLVVAFTATARRKVGDRWLLAILLSGTSGAAFIALLTVLATGMGDDGAASRFIDVAVVFIGLTALTAAVRVVAAHRPDAPAAPPRDGV